MLWSQTHVCVPWLRKVRDHSKIAFNTRPHPQPHPQPLPRQNGLLFADDIFRCIFVNDKFYILVKISLTFVLKGPIDNNPVMVQIMARRRIGIKPLSEPMPILSWFTDVYVRHWGVGVGGGVGGGCGGCGGVGVCVCVGGGGGGGA